MSYYCSALAKRSKSTQVYGGLCLNVRMNLSCGYEKASLEAHCDDWWGRLYVLAGAGWGLLHTSGKELSRLAQVQSQSPDPDAGWESVSAVPLPLLMWEPIKENKKVNNNTHTNELFQGL